MCKPSSGLVLRCSFENDADPCYVLLQFGFDSSNAWQARKDHLVSTLYNNPKAKFVTRVIQFGSEPLLDNAMEANALASQIWALKSKIAPLGIAVTISEMA